jgi:hypothetical protein
MQDALRDERMGTDIDKKEVTYAFRLPAFTKFLLEQLSPSQKAKLNEALLMTCARVLHHIDFNPSRYLSTKD